jgi:hypothetical protein
MKSMAARHDEIPCEILLDAAAVTTLQGTPNPEPSPRSLTPGGDAVAEQADLFYRRTTDAGLQGIVPDEPRVPAGVS